MFNTSIVTAGLLGLVGFRQPFDPVFAIIDANNLGSESGLFVNDNSFAKIEYLKDSQDYAKISDAQFNELLVNQQKQSITNVCNAVFNDSSYIDKQVLFANTFNKIDLELLPIGFVGYKIEVGLEKNIAFEINRVLLDFDGSGDIELLLFNTAQKAPIKSQVISIATDHEAFALNWVVDNSGSTYKGDYYLGYLSDYAGIGTLKPYKRDYNKGDIKSNITYLTITRGLFLNQTTNILQDLEDWDNSEISNGVNPDITVFEDFTELILNNKRLFANAINYDMQLNVLAEIDSSIRSNRNKRVGESMLARIQLEIEGQSAENGIKVTGLRPQLYKSLGVLRKEIKSLTEGYFGKRGMVITMM